MFGQTRVRYGEALVSLILTLRFLCRKPIILLPFFTFLSMCLFQERFKEIPRYLDCVSASRVWFLRLETKRTGDRARVMQRMLHLLG